MVGTGTVTVWDTVIPEWYSAKKDKEYTLFTKNQWKFPEWAWERATREYLGRSVQQDGYWSKDPKTRSGAVFKGTGR